MKLGIIGGTALEQLALESRAAVRVSTPWGETSGPIHQGCLADTEILFINRHGDDHRIPPHKINYQANLAALHQQGVDGVIAISAVGGINCDLSPGALVLPHQLIDYTWGREHTYCDGANTNLVHVDFTHPYCPALRRQLIAAARRIGQPVMTAGVHGVTQGPRLETAAEISRMEHDGCDLVGMTGMPEAALARELGLPYACLALVVNPAAGKSEVEITMEDISRVMENAVPNVIALLTEFCRATFTQN